MSAKSKKLTQHEGSAAAAVDGRPAPASTRKSALSKDVPAFEWKVIGESHGLALTLFKAVSREDAEAQLERLCRDGYYTHLRVVPIGEPVHQSAEAMAAANARYGAKRDGTAKASRSTGKSTARRRDRARTTAQRDSSRVRSRSPASSKTGRERKTSRKKSATTPARKRPARKK